MRFIFNSRQLPFHFAWLAVGLSSKIRVNYESHFIDFCICSTWSANWNIFLRPKYLFCFTYEMCVLCCSPWWCCDDMMWCNGTGRVSSVTQQNVRSYNCLNIPVLLLLCCFYIAPIKQTRNNNISQCFHNISPRSACDRVCNKIRVDNEQDWHFEH